jgi:hypothetical protein
MGEELLVGRRYARWRRRKSDEVETAIGPSVAKVRRPNRENLINRWRGMV